MIIEKKHQFPLSQRGQGGLSVNLSIAKVYAPFPMTRTIGDLTFYMMDGMNYVRTKSSLTRKRVLKSPNFRKTRLYAGLMAQASKIGSVIYQALPPDWRQAWMYRAFTGEAMQILKEGRTIEETTRLLWERYVEAINHHGEDLSGRLEDAVYSAAKPPRGKRKKPDPRVERLKPYSDLLAGASKMASSVYNSLPPEKRKFAIYQAWVGEAMQFLHAEEKESESQLPITKALCTNVDAESLSALDEALVQALGDSAAMVLVPQGSVKISKKSNKLPTKNRLFYIPPVDHTLRKRFASRPKHQFRLVNRSP
jgi:hypothetical protein